MIHELLTTWFHWVEVWGYTGIFFLMAMESSIIPVPSEIVMPPAAFWAAQGRFSLAGVILAGTAGSYFGSIVSYWISSWIGQPFLDKYGKFIFLPPQKLIMAENWVKRYGASGIFIARLLPVIRHLISIPAGVLKMPYNRFSVATLLGAGLWCSILSWFGQEVIGGQPELLSSPEAMIHAIKAKMHWFAAAVFIMGVLYGLTLWFKKKFALRTVELN